MTELQRRPVVLDVDTGIDDALAIMLAVAHPGLDVRGITCVGGNVPLAQVVENTLGVLALMGADVPVAAGMTEPLLQPPQHASHVHGANGIADIELPAHRMRPVEEHAVELLRRTIVESSTPVTLISLAPLTNIAVLLRMHPEVTEHLERIVVMGGAIGHGNATAVAEFNVWHDPEAAEVVFRSSVPTTMYGLEPFYRVAIDGDRIAAFAGSAVPRARFAGRMLQHLALMTVDEDRLATPETACIGDAGAVCAVIDPAGLAIWRAPVQVVLDGTVARGQTIVDLRPGAADAGSPPNGRSLVDVVHDVGAERYRDLFLTTLFPDGY
jgi:pyrimidine-specific ribonucleoside hydrolase